MKTLSLKLCFETVFLTIIFVLSCFFALFLFNLWSEIVWASGVPIEVIESQNISQAEEVGVIASSEEGTGDNQRQLAQVLLGIFSGWNDRLYIGSGLILLFLILWFLGRYLFRRQSERVTKSAIDLYL